jgi:hypothetical protein
LLLLQVKAQPFSCTAIEIKVKCRRGYQLAEFLTFVDPTYATAFFDLRISTRFDGVITRGGRIEGADLL